MKDLHENVQKQTSIALEQSRRYDSLCTNCRACDGRTELTTLIRHLDPAVTNPVRPPHHRFVPPQIAQSPEAANGEPLPQTDVPYSRPMFGERITLVHGKESLAGRSDVGVTIGASEILRSHVSREVSVPAGRAPRQPGLGLGSPRTAQKVPRLFWSF
ncbi:hypothetical protein E2C01_040798 [Portunus trituberculatus]|uniref:Uncharacterized protein n=1 Tax=Portunus trituberculatus TaxID=210409 RepID=A0A5B7FRR5_PORTR|nr:hypothetical protein [Portunus trituberculatus]